MPTVAFHFSENGIGDIVGGLRAISKAGVAASNALARASGKSQSASDSATRKRIANEDKQLAALEKRLNKEMALEEKAAKKKAALDAREKARKAKQDAKDSQTFFKGAGRIPLAAAGLAIGAATSAMATIGAGARDAMELDETTNRISINARQKGTGFFDPRQMSKDFLAAAVNAPGIEAKDIAKGAAVYSAKTGDVNGFMKNLSTLTTAASATGASFEDTASMAAELKEKFGLVDPEALQSGLATLVDQSKRGGFEINDLAALFARSAAGAGAFGLTGQKGMQETGALLQMSRANTGSAEAASTGVENIFTALGQKESKFKAKGVKYRDKDGNNLGINNVIAQSLSKMTKQENLKLFGEQGSRPLLGMMAGAEKAKKDAGGGKKGEQAAFDYVMAQLNETGGAIGDWKEVMRDAAQAQSTTGAKITAAWQSLVQQVHEKAIPAIDALAPKLLDLATNCIPPLVSAFKVGVDMLTILANDIKTISKWFEDEADKKLSDDQKERNARIETARAEIKAIDDDLASGGLTKEEEDEMREKRADLVKIRDREKQGFEAGEKIKANNEADTSSWWNADDRDTLNAGNRLLQIRQERIDRGEDLSMPDVKRDALDKIQAIKETDSNPEQVSKLDAQAIQLQQQVDSLDFSTASKALADFTAKVYASGDAVNRNAGVVDR